MENEFRDYLIKKKIDPEAFQKNEPVTFSVFEGLFYQMHPESFTMKKLFLINIIRRKYQLTVGDRKAPPAGKAKVKPVVKNVVQPKKEDTTEKRSSKPVMKKPAVKPKVTGEKSAKAARPLMKKPVIKSGEEGEGKKAAAKPIIKKPLVRPKIKSKEEGENVNTEPSPKPIMKKPVVKPKITPKPKKEVEEEIKPSSKPVSKKPIIKPKIQPKKNKEE